MGTISRPKISKISKIGRNNAIPFVNLANALTGNKLADWLDLHGHTRNEYHDLDTVYGHRFCHAYDNVYK